MSLRKIGGLWFLKLGRCTFMFCVSKRTMRTHPADFVDWPVAWASDPIINRHMNEADWAAWEEANGLSR